jgi:hypothetical protein
VREAAAWEATTGWGKERRVEAAWELKDRRLGQRARDGEGGAGGVGARRSAASGAMRMACFCGEPDSGEGRLRSSEEEMRSTVASDQMG